MAESGQAFQVHKLSIRNANEEKSKMQEKIIVYDCSNLAVVFKLYVLAAVN